ncbi:MAG: MFS transporter [Coriobacteriales bacterium]|jgi:MFS family permease|nr:MFS transporter [Coriobacteriales bacterium]
MKKASQAPSAQSLTKPATKTGGFQYWHLIVILLCFGWAAVWVYRTVLTPIYGEIQAALHVTSDAQIGLIASMYFFSYTGMQIPSGLLVDRFGSKAVLIPGFALFAIGALVIGTASSLTMVYAGAILAGLGSGAYYGGAYSLSARHIPSKNRTFANAIINSGSALGMALGLIGSSYLIKSFGLPWNIALFIAAGIILTAAICMAGFIRNRRKVEQLESAAAEAKAAQEIAEGVAAVATTSPAAATAAAPATTVAPTADEPVEDLSQKTTLFSLRSISTYLLYFATCYGYYMLVTWLPRFLETERGFTGVAIGMSAALVAFASVPGALVFGRLFDRFRSKRIHFIVVLELLAAVTFLLVVFVPSAGLLLAGLVCYGLVGKLAVDPMLISLVSDNAPIKKVGRFLTTFNFCGMSSSVIAPFVTGVISDQFLSKVGGFYLACGLIVACTLFFLLVNLRKSKAARPVEAAQAVIE